MAVITNGSSGNWSSASTWQVINPVALTATRAGQENNGAATTTAYVGLAAGIVIASAIDVDAIVMRFSLRSTTLGGTFSVRLYNVTAAAAVAGTTVTVNVNDLPAATVASPSLITFKFAAPITTIAGNAYRVEILSSVSASVTMFRKSATAGDWTFGLRTTTNQVPTAGDQVYVQGDYTGLALGSSYLVTYDTTAAVTIGASTTGASALEVSAKGTLQWATAAASTYSTTLNGDLILNQDGTMTVGTLASPIPSTSTATLIFNCTTNVQYGTLVRHNSVFTTYGATKTTKAYLAANAVAGATTLQTSVATGWASGDIIAVASTSRLISECEQVTLSGPASGTSVPISALGFNHDGSALSNVAKAEIINLNRNVVIRGASATLQTNLTALNTSIITTGFTEFQWFGSASISFRGIEITSTLGGAFTATGCSYRNFEVSGSYGIFINTVQPNVNINNCVFYRQNSVGIGSIISTTTSTTTINDCWLIGGTGTTASAGFQLAMNSGTFTNINAAGSGTYGVGFIQTLAASPFVASNIICHSCVGTPITINSSSEQTTTATQYSNLLVYRSQVEGILFTGTQNVIVDGLISFGNTTRGITYNLAFDVIIKNISLYSEVGYTQTAGIVFANHADNLVIENGTCGVLGAHTTADINDVCPRNQHNLVIKNVTFGSPTLYAGQSNHTPKTYTGIARLNGVAGSHRTYYKYGILTSDTTFFQVLSPSVRMTPNNATQKFQGPVKEVAVPAGRSARVSVWVRKSVIGDGTTYNGNEAQLLVQSNAAAGIATDTVIATSTTASNGAFELISGTTAAVTDNVALKFLVQCDGTLGWINVDRWMVELV